MKFSANRIVFDQIVLRRNFKHDVEQLIDVQYRLLTQTLSIQTLKKIADVARRYRE